MPISFSINVDRIDKSKFIKGKKGRYLNLVLWETPESEYGDYLVKQQGERGEKLPILGNGKNFGKGGATKKASSSYEPGEDSDDGNEPW
jgi:hypothetical protein